MNDVIEACPACQAEGKTNALYCNGEVVSCPIHGVVKDENRLALYKEHKSQFLTGYFPSKRMKDRIFAKLDQYIGYLKLKCDVRKNINQRSEINIDKSKLDWCRSSHSDIKNAMYDQISEKIERANLERIAKQYEKNDYFPESVILKNV